MKIVICDDDLFFVEQLKEYILNYFHEQTKMLPEISCYADGKELLSVPSVYDILFLDIEMPDINGIDVGKEIKKQNSKTIIFVITSFPEYLDEAMRFQVFRYLSKPLDKERLFRNLTDALCLYHSFSASIPVETKNEIITLSSSDIIMVEAKEREVLVYTTSNQYNSIHTIQYWDDLLPKNIFFRTHRSYLVNLEHVSKFDHSLIYLCINRYKAYLTRRKYTNFKNTYLLYLETMR